MSNLTSDYQYEDIPSINRDEFRILHGKKEKGETTEIEDLQLNKYNFQCYLITDEINTCSDIIPMDREIMAWNNYCDEHNKLYKNDIENISNITNYKYLEIPKITTIDELFALEIKKLKGVELDELEELKLKKYKFQNILYNIEDKFENICNVADEMLLFDAYCRHGSSIFKKLFYIRLIK
jgi:hypothetical protein